MSEDKNLLGKVGGFLGDLKDKAVDAAGDFAENAKEFADHAVEGIKDKAEDIIGEENVKKATDFLNTDVKDIAADLKDKAGDAVEGIKDKAEELGNKVTHKLG